MPKPYKRFLARSSSPRKDESSSQWYKIFRLAPVLVEFFGFIIANQA